MSASTAAIQNRTTGFRSPHRFMPRLSECIAVRSIRESGTPQFEIPKRRVRECLVQHIGHAIALAFRATAAPPNSKINAIGISERASPAPKEGSPRLKDAHSDGGEPGGGREKMTASSNVRRLTEVWPGSVAWLQGAGIG